MQYCKSIARIITLLIINAGIARIIALLIINAVLQKYCKNYGIYCSSAKINAVLAIMNAVLQKYFLCKNKCSIIAEML